MALIKSISGIRGTIGKNLGEDLTPLDVVRFTAAYGSRIKRNNRGGKELKIVVGRDARISGEMVRSLVCGTLIGLGFEVVDLDLSTTPTVELAVTRENALGGIIITASHNPKQWNALKLLNEKGEFLSAQDGEEVLEIAGKDDYGFVEIDEIGKITPNDNAINKHIEEVLALPLVNKAAIAKQNFKIAIDCVNSTGALILPKLLKSLGVENIIELNCTPNGNFPHNPEPLPENLGGIMQKVKATSADLGIVVDPDVDRLAFITEKGECFGEEYTLVAVSDYVLRHQKGNTVSNLSSTMALRDVTKKQDCNYFASAVGEVNVVEKMKVVNAVIGGEGNGGVIYPELHYGRDAMVGIALFLSHLATINEGKKTTCSELRATYPNYFISKTKIALAPTIAVDKVLNEILTRFNNQYKIDKTDGLKIFVENDWVQLRKSNTEPIIRIYAESATMEKAENLTKRFITEIQNTIQQTQKV